MEDYEAAPYAWPRWCHGRINRQMAEERLLVNRNQNPFLVRQRDTSEFVMSIRWDASGISHTLIRKQPNGHLQMDGVPHAFADLSGVITHYVQVYNGTITPIAADGSAVIIEGATHVPPPMPAQGFGSAPPPPAGHHRTSGMYIPTAIPVAAQPGSAFPMAMPVHAQPGAAYPTAVPVGQPQQAASPWILPQTMPRDDPPPPYQMGKY